MNVEYDIELQETGQSLAANTVINGNSYDGVAQGGNYGKFRLAVVSDVAGTLNIQQSPDGVTWYTSTSIALTAGVTLLTVLESLWTLTYVRGQYVTGTGTTTVVKMFSQFVSNT